MNTINDWCIISLDDYNSSPPMPESLSKDTVTSMIELQPLLSTKDTTSSEGDITSSEGDITSSEEDEESTIESLSPISAHSENVSITVECPELLELCELLPYEEEAFLYQVLLECNYNLNQSLTMICFNGIFIRRLRKSIQKEPQKTKTTKTK